MARYAAFRRQPVDPQVAQQLRTITFPAPTRGIIQSENESYMKPGGAVIQDNWAPTMRGVKLRGGHTRWCDLHAGETDPVRLPVISAFEYDSGSSHKMFAGQATKLFDVTASTPTLVKSGQTNGNYSAAQFANQGGDWMVVCNDGGDYPLRYNGTSWVTLDPGSGTPAGTPTDGASRITGPVDSNVEHGHNLGYVWKYRSRLYFIEVGTLNAWFLPTDAVGGLLQLIPLGGATTRGGKLIAGAAWSIEAGDTNVKNVFITDLGELLIFSGSDPSDPENWKQEGRYQISAPLGSNAHIQVGGDLMILTVDGVVPVSQAVAKTGGQLELATLSRTIKPLWRETVVARRGQPWTAKNWNEYGAVFVAAPGGRPGERFCLVANNVTNAWARFTNWDATCFIRLQENMFFGTQDGRIMQADRSGYDDGVPYTATLIGGWETFGAPANQIVWHQSRAAFKVGRNQPFIPQISAITDYVVIVPTAPPAGIDPGTGDVWDQGKWGPPGSGSIVPPPPADVEAYCQWDQESLDAALTPIRNTLWVSIGRTGFAHAFVVQVTVAQQTPPVVELVAVAATYEPGGVNV